METARANIKLAEEWKTKYINIKKQLDTFLVGNSSLTLKKTSVPVIKEDALFRNGGQSFEQDVKQEFVKSVQVVQKR